MSELILASASAIRASLLSKAGFTFSVHPAAIDEEALRRDMPADRENPTPADVAEVLARAKAAHVSSQYPDALVIGADQILALDGEIFAKPADMIEARHHLARLRARPHFLFSALACARRGQAHWSDVSQARLNMRDFSDAFLDDYLREMGQSALSSVGAYQLEGRGIQLFDQIEGDYFTILGLPLLPLLTQLRREGLARS